MTIELDASTKRTRVIEKTLEVGEDTLEFDLQGDKFVAIVTDSNFSGTAVTVNPTLDGSVFNTLNDKDGTPFGDITIGADSHTYLDNIMYYASALGIQVVSDTPQAGSDSIIKIVTIMAS